MSTADVARMDARLSGPDMFWFVVDGPSTTCGDTMTSISLVPTN